jgi:hypothetical protein
MLKFIHIYVVIIAFPLITECVLLSRTGFLGVDEAEFCCFCMVFM